MKSQPVYDLLLKGGKLIDPGQNVDDRRDIAFKDGKVAEVSERIDPTTATEVIDIAGKLVTPGLVDLHGHFYDGGIMGATDPDDTCLPAGVTTGVDAGSAGWANYRAMRDYVFPAKKVRFLAFLHIAGSGLLLNPVVGGELHDARIADADRTADAVKENPGFVVGVKARMHVDAMPYWEARNILQKGREAADKAGVKYMVHVSGTPISLPEILDVLGPGDIVTHIFNGNPEGILDGSGKVRSEVRDAANRGVIMDVAHAGIHFDVDVATAALRQDFLPHTISTDVHRAPPGRVLYLLNDLISKFHAMGMPLADAVAASTIVPAKILGLDKRIGSLRPGMEADAAVFDLAEGLHVWQDGSGKTVEGELRLATYLTVLGGQIVWRQNKPD